MASKILIADDSSAIQKVIKIAFSSLGAEMQIAATYGQALGLVSTSTFDLIIVDLGLPGIKNLDDFRSFANQLPEQCPIIYMLGSHENLSEEQIERLLGKRTQLIKKPFDANELVNLATHLLGRREESNASGSKEKLMVDSAKKGIPAFSAATPSDEPPPPPPPQFAANAPAMTGFDQPHLEITSPRINLNFEQLTQASHYKEQIRGSERVAPPSKQELIDMVEPLLHQLLPELIKQSIENYCQKHYKDIVREVVIKELRRLSEEKTRFINEE